MANKLPNLSARYRVCIICEGNEEYAYISRLLKLGVWKKQYDIVLVNAGGNGNIPARYQDRYQNDSDEVVFVFCDTEKKPHEQYEDIKAKINALHGVNDAASEVVFFGNPCTMQIISKHWTEESICSPAKPVNAPLIERLTGVKNYKARKDQLDEVMKCVTSDNYSEMKYRINELETDDSLVGSSNFGKLLAYFESDDASWIRKVNEVLEQ